MKNDISFIPEKLMTEELKVASERKIEYPYITGDPKVINKLKLGETKTIHSEFFKQRLQYKQNFWSFEDELLDFAKKQFELKNLELAEQCFKYLVNIGSKSAKVKEYLVKIYKKTGDKRGLSWIKYKINNQLNEPEDFHNQKVKLGKLIEKYF